MSASRISPARRAILCALGAVALFAAGAAPAATAARYLVTDLGTLYPETGETLATALNRSGQATGQTSTPDGTGTQAFLYAGGQLHLLGTLGGYYSVGLAINRGGLVAGLAFLPDNFTVRAFLSAGNGMTDLGTLGGPSSVARALNDKGHVAGSADTASGTIHAFVWRGGFMRDLGTLGGEHSDAFAINAAGQVAGDSETAEGTRHAFVYAHGQMTDLTPDDLWSTAMAINEYGVVVGAARHLATHPQRAFIANASNQLTDLGDPLGGGSSALAVNRHGVAVGYSMVPDGSYQHAYLWKLGRATDLNGMLDPLSGQGVVLEVARGINDSGEIVAVGTRNGGPRHSFLLTPR